jgi:UrcA family protein
MRHRGFSVMAGIGLMMLVGNYANACTTAPQVHVRYGDLDLATAAGYATLRQRLRLAAEQVCGDGGGFALAARQHRCVLDAVDKALAQVELHRRSAAAPASG